MTTTSGPLQTPGPSVHLPGNVPLARGTVAPSMNLQTGGPHVVGYTPAHASYSIARQERMQQVYSTHSGEVVVVEVRMVHMPPGCVQVSLIHVSPINEKNHGA